MVRPSKSAMPMRLRPLQVVLLLATSAKALSGKTDAQTLSHVEVQSTGAALQEQEDSASSDGTSAVADSDSEDDTLITRASRSSFPSSNEEMLLTARSSSTTATRLRRAADAGSSKELTDVSRSTKQLTEEELEERGVLNQETPDAKNQDQRTGTDSVDDGSVVAGQEGSIVAVDNGSIVASSTSKKISGSKVKPAVSTSTSTSSSLIEEDTLTQKQKAFSREGAKVQTDQVAVPAAETRSTSSKTANAGEKEETAVTDSIQGQAPDPEPKEDHSSSTKGETEFLEDHTSEKAGGATSRTTDTSGSTATDWYVYVDYVTSYIDTTGELPADFGSKALGDPAFLDILQKEIVTATGIQSVTVPQYQPGAPARVYDFTIPTAPEPPLITLGVLLLTALGILELATIGVLYKLAKEAKLREPLQNPADIDADDDEWTDDDDYEGDDSVPMK
ncbi:unnamed protein product [Amoebophrya sp. A25]|nr:unnamed protein product [Amoebophrya sp. A25]|eukprot:GSA25T00025934001.1